MIVILGALCCLLRLRPPSLHHRRQFPPHGGTHRATTSGVSVDRSSPFGPPLALLPCPPCFLGGGDSSSRCRAHAATLQAARCLGLAHLGWTTPVVTRLRKTFKCGYGSV